MILMVMWNTLWLPRFGKWFCVIEERKIRYVLNAKIMYYSLILSASVHAYRFLTLFLTWILTVMDSEVTGLIILVRVPRRMAQCSSLYWETYSSAFVHCWWALQKFPSLWYIRCIRIVMITQILHFLFWILGESKYSLHPHSVRPNAGYRLL